MPNVIEQLSADLLRLAQERDGAARLLTDLPARFSPKEIANEGDQQRSWDWLDSFTSIATDGRRHCPYSDSCISTC